MREGERSLVALPSFVPRITPSEPLRTTISLHGTSVIASERVSPERPRLKRSFNATFEQGEWRQLQVQLYKKNIKKKGGGGRKQLLVPSPLTLSWPAGRSVEGLTDSTSRRSSVSPLPWADGWETKRVGGSAGVEPSSAINDSH